MREQIGVFVKQLKEAVVAREMNIMVTGGRNGGDVKVKEEMMDEAMGGVDSENDDEEEEEDGNFNGEEKALAIELTLQRKEKIKLKVKEGLDLRKGRTTYEQTSVDANAFKAGVKRAEVLPTCYSLS